MIPQAGATRCQLREEVICGGDGGKSYGYFGIPALVHGLKNNKDDLFVAVVVENEWHNFPLTKKNPSQTEVVVDMLQ